ncbi:hypothetical protein GCM10010278_16400 [Streptomyces melanogenes]|nr:hypothetical protein GCM10010278_16400 [Streptomyces melanogenes]
MTRKHGSLAHSGKVKGLTPKADGARKVRRGGRKLLASVVSLSDVSFGNPKRSKRRVAQVKFPNGSEATAYIPRGVQGVTEGSPVLLRASRMNEIPGVSLRIVKWQPPRMTLSGHSYGSVAERVPISRITHIPRWYKAHYEKVIQ